MKLYEAYQNVTVTTENLKVHNTLDTEDIGKDKTQWMYIHTEEWLYNTTFLSNTQTIDVHTSSAIVQKHTIHWIVQLIAIVIILVETYS